MLLKKISVVVMPCFLGLVILLSHLSFSNGNPTPETSANPSSQMKEATTKVTATAPTTKPTTAPTTKPNEIKLPKLVELGADRCIPCKKMKPILDELREEYRGRMEVVFIDVWKAPAEGKKYGVQSIPTQIFLNAEGKELDRHVGFISKDDILARWKELSVEFNRSIPKK